MKNLMILGLFLSTQFVVSNFDEDYDAYERSMQKQKFNLFAQKVVTHKNSSTVVVDQQIEKLVALSNDTASLHNDITHKNIDATHSSTSSYFGSSWCGGFLFIASWILFDAISKK